MTSARRAVGRRLVGALALAALSALAAERDAPLAVDGNVAQPLALSVDDLRRLPAHDVRYAPARRGEPPSSERRYTGCLLRDVLAVAKPTETQPRDLRRSYVLASAADGYAVTFAWPELVASPTGDGVYVVYARDGKPIGADEGPIALVVTSDRSPMRHVKWLHTLTVRRAD